MKVQLLDIVSLQNETTATSRMNSNSTSIEDAIENTLSRNGESPNEMLSNLDMNDHRILNLPEPASATEPVRLQDITGEEVFELLALAENVEFTPAGTIAAANVQDAIEEVASEAAADLAAHINDAADAHDASAISFTPSGSIAATNVQDAIAEIVSEDDETAQDAVGSILADTATIDFTYNDAVPSITADVINDSITFAKIQNIATDRLLGRDTASSGDVEELTITQALDFVGSAAQGDILYRNASAWTRLGAGTSGQFLKTNGTGANPAWADGSGVFRTLRSFGAIGDGTTNDASAIATAIASGFRLDGEFLTYGVNGNITLSNDTYIRKAKFKQLTPAAAGDVRTLVSSGGDRITLKEVIVDRNGDGTNGQLGLDAGIFLENTDNFLLEDCEVFGSDIGNGIVCQTCTKGSIVRTRVHDILYSLGADPGDDRVQGIWLNSCTDVNILNCHVEDLGGNFGSGATTRYSRGIARSGCTNCHTTDTIVRDADQGFDDTGSAGNRNNTTTACQAIGMFTYGFKAANTAIRCKYIACYAEDCGFSSFIASGPAEASLPNSVDIMYIGCTARNTGSNGEWAGSDPVAFWVAPNAFDLDFPRGVKFINCRSVDDQGTATTEYGFRNTTTFGGQPLNECINCVSEGHLTAAFAGFPYPACRLIRSSDQTLANSTATSIEWNAEDYDGSAMHSTSSNPELVTIGRAGWYRAYAQLHWTANATGLRQMELLKSGVLVPRALSTIAGHASVNEVQSLSATVFCNAGDTLRIRATQTSGGNLNVFGTSSGSFFEVAECMPYGS